MSDKKKFQLTGEGLEAAKEWRKVIMEFFKENDALTAAYKVDLTAAMEKLNAGRQAAWPKLMENIGMPGKEMTEAFEIDTDYLDFGGAFMLYDESKDVTIETMVANDAKKSMN